MYRATQVHVVTAQAARGREDAADDDVDRGDIELGDMEEGCLLYTSDAADE